MTDNPYQLMAKQFVDMWQKQLSDMLVDEKFVSTMIDTMHQSGGFPHANTGQAPAADAAVSSEPANAALGQLERRLASAEGRIAELEREMAQLRRELADGTRQPAAATSRKPRAGKPKR